MAIDFTKVEEYVNNVKRVEEDLAKYQELFDPEKLLEFRQVTTALEQSIEVAKNDSRKLSIGIVGAVKAGKSSFLNACIFDGEEYLPKAATPMTAALTRITYSDTPKAVIHFYTNEDWNTIVKQSNMYDEGLKNAYDAYCNRIYAQNTPSTYGYGATPVSVLMSQDEYEKSQYKCPSETQCGAKELTRMAADPTLLDKLGGTDEISGDIIAKLNDYVGANGYYTPIVNYVELQVDNPYVEDFEIVDTPGLNDPIVSRGIRTKQFLRSCDVVLLLSPCSQFMDARMIDLMAASLPDAGVREIVVIGSKLDSGILNESTDDFAVAYKDAVDCYKSQFLKSISDVKQKGRRLDALDKFDLQKVIFSSSTCFTIAKKLKNNITLDENEQKVYDNLHTVFRNFDDKYLGSLGGISKVRMALNAVLERKVEIIEGKSSGLLDNAKINHLQVLEKIIQETVSSSVKLETVTAEELRQRSSNIRDVIDASRKKIMYIFEGAVTDCDKKVQRILPELAVESEKHQKLSIKQSTHDEHTTERVGLFGLKTEIINYKVMEYSADVSDVIKNLKQYAAKCHSYVNGEFEHIFNKEVFSQKIKEVVLHAFEQGQKEFDEDDILRPLQNVLAKISIPHIKVDVTEYIDEVDTRFQGGYAKNQDIHRLSSLQSNFLNRIEKNLMTQLAGALSEMTKTLNTQAVCFADQIEKEFCSELEKLQSQAIEKERYIEAYKKFAGCLREMKADIAAM